MPNQLPDETFFARMSDVGETTPTTRASSRLKSRIYSALVRRQQETGPLLSLPATEAAGEGLCVFEKLVRIAPLGEEQKCFNLCSVCHARWLGEHIENAPIFWANCPYVAFKKS
jgi:hypothetical protein